MAVAFPTLDSVSPEGVSCATASPHQIDGRNCGNYGGGGGGRQLTPIGPCSRAITLCRLAIRPGAGAHATIIHSLTGRSVSTPPHTTKTLHRATSLTQRVVRQRNEHPRHQQEDHHRIDKVLQDRSSFLDHVTLLMKGFHQADTGNIPAPMLTSITARLVPLRCSPFLAERQADR